MGVGTGTPCCNKFVCAPGLTYWYDETWASPLLDYARTGPIEFSEVSGKLEIITTDFASSGIGFASKTLPFEPAVGKVIEVSATMDGISGGLAFDDFTVLFERTSNSNFDFTTTNADGSFNTTNHTLIPIGVPRLKIVFTVDAITRSGLNNINAEVEATAEAFINGSSIVSRTTYVAHAVSASVAGWCLRFASMSKRTVPSEDVLFDEFLIEVDP